MLLYQADVRCHIRRFQHFRSLADITTVTVKVYDRLYDVEKIGHKSSDISNAKKNNVILEGRYYKMGLKEENFDSVLTEKIENAVEKAVIKLFEEHKENFYYCSLITSGEAERPILSAWSWEALDRISENNEDKEDLKWSYADSPYCMFGEEFLSELDEVFQKRPCVADIDDDIEYDKEISIRINSMEKALSNLDKKGLFGTGEDRKKIVINAEFMPPDYSNTERAIRLNPKDALVSWLEEAAEEDEEEDY